MNYTQDFRYYQTKNTQELKQTINNLDDNSFDHSQNQQNTMSDQLKLSKLKINFQQKYQDYIEDQTLNTSIPIIPNSRFQLDQKLKNLQPITARQRSSRNRSVDSDEQIFDRIKEMQNKEKLIETDKYDYKKLYRKIKLKALEEEANQSQTLQKQDKSQNRLRNQYLNNNQIIFISNNNSRTKNYKNITHSSSFRMSQQKKQTPKLNYHQNKNSFNQLINNNHKKLSNPSQKKNQKNYRYNFPHIVKKGLTRFDKDLQSTLQIEKKMKMMDQIFQKKSPDNNTQQIKVKNIHFKQQNTLTNEQQQQAPTKPIYNQQLLKKTQKNISSSPPQQLEIEISTLQPQKPKILSQEFSQTKTKTNQKKTELNNEDQTLSRVNSRLHQNSGQFKQNLILSQKNNFNIKVYMKIYYSLKIIQQNIKNSNLLKGIKNYLELIGSGKIDNYEYIKTTNHRKTLKMSLLYQRISIIIISFIYASNTMNQYQKYVINLIKLIVNNYLIILKILSSEYNKQMQNDIQYKQIWILSNQQFENKGFQTLKEKNQIIIHTIYKLAKYDRIFYQNLRKIIKNAAKFTIQQTFYFILQYFSFFLNICQLDQKIPFLSVAPNPYLPPIHASKYTLVIDLLQTMCHPKRSELVRPYSQYFLDQISRYFQIVIFSITFPNQINKLIQYLDKNKHIKHRLYKHHSINSNGIYLKDLTRLGRNMQTTILLDSQQNQINKQNCLFIKPWDGNNKDTVLADICPLLSAIVINNLDIRQGIQNCNNIIFNNIRRVKI